MLIKLDSQVPYCSLGHSNIVDNFSKQYYQHYYTKHCVLTLYCKIVKVPITPKTFFCLMKSLYGTEENAAKIFAFG